MESSITNPQSFDDSKLAEPHFDDEVTLLSAKPVVPLHQVRTRPSFGRSLGFGLAFVSALLIGALSATMVYKFRDGDGRATATVETGQAEEQLPEKEPQDASGGITSTASNASESTSTSTPQEEKGALNAESGLQKEAEKRPSTKAAGSESAVKDTVPVEEAPADSDGSLGAPGIEAEPADYDREARRAARREARRLKHGKKGRTADEVLRIREIFEGSPRP